MTRRQIVLAAVMCIVLAAAGAALAAAAWAWCVANACTFQYMGS